MQRMINLVLVALLLLAAPVAAGEVWEKQLGEKITAVATDERGDRIFVGAESGDLYCYDAGGNVVWQKTLSRVPSALHADGTGDYLLIGFAGDQNFDLYDATTGNSVFSRGWGPSYRAGDISRSGDAYAYIFSHQPYFGIAGNTRNTGKIWYEGVLSGATAPAIAGDASWAVVGTGSDIKKYALNIPDKDKEGWIAAEGRGEFRNRVAHTIGGSASTLTNLPVEINVTRTAGTNTGNTLYAPDCQANFNDVRFTTTDGAELRFNKKSVQGSTATFLVEIPELPPAGTTIYIYWGYMPFYGGASDKSDSSITDTPLLSDDFEDGVIADVWQISGSVTETGGYLDLYDGSSTEGHGPATATVPALANIPCHIVANVSIPSMDIYGGEGFHVGFPIGVASTYIRQLSGGLATITWAGASQPDVTVPRDTTHTMEIWWAPGGTGRWKYGTAWDFSTSSAGTSNPFRFIAGTSAQGWKGAIRIHDITVYPYTAAIPRTWGTVERAVYSQATKTLDGTIIDIDAPETGDWVAVSTTTKTYIIQVTDSGFGTTYSADRTGTPYQIQVADGGSFAIEGRNILADIFRIDAVRVGTYTTGGPVQHVAIAQKNGLYAAAGSDDGKYYVFSKDAASSWYLLHASDSYDPVTAIAMSWRGEIAVIGRADGRLTAFQVSEQDATGAIRVTIYKDNIPYATAPIRIEDGGTDQSWGAPTTLTTDDYGIVSIPVSWGNYIRITVGDDELTRVLVATPSQTEYVLRIKGPDPLRTGAQYSSGYDPDTQRIYLHYDDTRQKTHRVVYQIVRSSDNTVVFEREYTDADLPVNDYYQIPAGWTNTSYRVRLTASGSPSFSNTWHQWISGESGVASLPVELSNTLKTGMFMVLLLFIGGIFSYFSGPHGAVVVSLVAAMLVFWGWLPISPAVIMLCVVWAFLGLLGRTSVG